MNNCFTTFCLLTHLGVNSIRATVVLNKNRLRKCTVAKRTVATLKSAHQEKKSNANLTVVGWNDKRAVYMASSKSSEPKRFVRRLNKVETKYNQETSDIYYEMVHYQVPSKNKGKYKVCKNNSRPRCVKCKVNVHDVCFEIFHGY